MIKKFTITLFVYLSLFASVTAKNSFTPIFKKSGVKIKDAVNLRDPFRRETRRGSRGGEARGRMLTNDKFSNFPVMGKVNLDSIKIVGVLLGENRRAIARITDVGGKVGDSTFIIKEGMKIGLNNAEVKAIVPGGIVIAEKIRNVYEEDEYIETVIPITLPNIVK
jgi:type IV pilus assembly protein PilP